MAIIHVNSNSAVVPISAPIKPTGKFNIDAMYEAEYISDLWKFYPREDLIGKYIQEGQQVYITKGSQWVIRDTELGPYQYPDVIPNGYERVRYEDKKYDVLTSSKHKGEIWVLTDLSKISNDFLELDITNGFIEQNTGKIPGWTKLVNEPQVIKLLNTKQDRLNDGSADKSHLIWSSEGGWVPGKIKIEDIVPNEGKVKDSVLSFDGQHVIWKTLDTTHNLPTENKIEGNVLTVSKEGNLVWSSVSGFKIEKHGNLGTEEDPIAERYTLSNNTDSANIYSKEAVDHMLSWKNI